MSQSNTYNKVNICLPFEIFLQKKPADLAAWLCASCACDLAKWGGGGGWGEDDALFSKKICQLPTKTDIQNW